MATTQENDHKKEEQGNKGFNPSQYVPLRGPRGPFLGQRIAVGVVIKSIFTNYVFLGILGAAFLIFVAGGIVMSGAAPGAPTQEENNTTATDSAH